MNFTFLLLKVGEPKVDSKSSLFCPCINCPSLTRLRPEVLCGGVVDHGNFINIPFLCRSLWSPCDRDRTKSFQFDLPIG